jgi:hypothetical protein
MTYLSRSGFKLDLSFPLTPRQMPVVPSKNQRDVLISQIYFWNRTLHVSDCFSVQHQESTTVHTAIGLCHTGYADCLLASSQHNLNDIYLLLCVQW